MYINLSHTGSDLIQLLLFHPLCPLLVAWSCRVSIVDFLCLIVSSGSSDNGGMETEAVNAQTQERGFGGCSTVAI
ncbi:hypothetical protein Nepgr_031954 [Nepenthes gracilis]|uniref:Uncharacterized protein n=1 Tax=Nepenthes gracilis TaxID=150966 RepID=A0AAD3TJF2_NEPGR|nr:hypothetical protein Nepgr_031954 [Nepenthes gracilis]